MSGADFLGRWNQSRNLLFVCHHTTPRSVPADVKALCDLLGQLVMLLVDKASEREEIEGFIDRQNASAAIKQAIERTASICDGFAEATDALLGLVAASGAAVRLNGKVRLFGITPSIEATDAVHTLGAKVTFELNLVAGLPFVLVDRSQLETVLINIAGNAGDAMP